MFGYIEHEVSADLNTELVLNKHIERNSQKKNGLDYDDNSSYGSDSWVRHKSAYIENTPFDYTQTITSKYSKGQWTKGYYYQNGTNLLECSDDGVNWSKDTCK
nr:hypothetical protein [Vibrio aestuarianus]